MTSCLLELTEAEDKTLKAKMLQLPPMPMDVFQDIIENIDEDYPFSLSPKIILILLVVMGIFIIALGVILIHGIKGELLFLLPLLRT